MDGYAVARQLKGDPATAHLPIVAITSYAMAGDRETVMAVGCDGYFENPSIRQFLWNRSVDIYPKGKESRWNKVRILIVDDKEESRYLLEVLLKGNGYHVEAAANGSEALEALRTGGFDLIVSDILMPVMDGFQLCREVKASPALKSIPLVFYTATYTGPKDEEFAMKVGADRFIRKPCEPDELLKAVQQVLEAAVNGRVKLGEIVAVQGDAEIYKVYNERLVRKLEQKMLALESEIRRRETAENELETSSVRLQLALQSANIGLWSWDQRTDEVWFSPEWKRQIGHHDHEISNRYEEWEKRLHPEDRQRVLAEVEAYLTGNSPFIALISASATRTAPIDGSLQWVKRYRGRMENLIALPGVMWTSPGIKKLSKAGNRKEEISGAGG